MKKKGVMSKTKELKHRIGVFGKALEKSDESELPPHLQRYRSAMKVLLDKISFYESMTNGMSVATHFRIGLEDIVQVLDEVDDLICQVNEEEIDYEYFRDERTILANEALSSVLDAHPSAVVGSQNKLPDAVEKQFAEIELLFERMWDDVREAGYEFYHYLIDAK